LKNRLKEKKERKTKIQEESKNLKNLKQDIKKINNYYLISFLELILNINIINIINK